MSCVQKMHGTNPTCLQFVRGTYLRYHNHTEINSCLKVLYTSTEPQNLDEDKEPRNLTLSKPVKDGIDVCRLIS